MTEKRLLVDDLVDFLKQTGPGWFSKLEDGGVTLDRFLTPSSVDGRNLDVGYTDSPLYDVNRVMNTSWINDPIPTPDATVRADAEARQLELTKPPGSLGRLEQIGIRLAALQGTQQPMLNKTTIVIFAGDHGIVDEGVSAFPQVVTAEMIRNFSRGGAAISVLARSLGAELQVINCGTVEALEALPGVLDRRIGPGTANFARQAAMTTDQLAEALSIGRDAIDQADAPEVFIGGEMGIGNTTSASALAAALLSADPSPLCGPGTGLAAEQVRHKAEIVAAALVQYQGNSALEALARFGGFEVAALTGACLRAAQRRIAIVVDGFISSAAALVAVNIRPEVRDYLFFSHRSAEPGHQLILDALQADPLLDIGMRLGEGSGAAVALPILRAAAELHGGMATFAEAGVSK